MPSIPNATPIDYAGVILIFAGIFLIITGLDILKIEKITVVAGRKTWAVGLFLTFIGVFFLMPNFNPEAAALSTPTNPTQLVTETPLPEIISPSIVLSPTIVPGIVSGRVLWNEQPVENARVVATDLYEIDSRQYGVSLTDAEGRFLISGIPEGKRALYIFGNQPGFWVAEIIEFEILPGAGTHADDSYLCKGFYPISPQENEIISKDQLLFIWDAFPEAVDYAIRIASESKSGFVYQRGDYDPRIKGTNLRIETPLDPGDYTWRVDAYNAEGHIIGCSYYLKSHFRVTD